MKKLVRLRKQTSNEEEFGRLAAPILDSMIADYAEVEPRRIGSWSDEERDILRSAYANFSNDAAEKEAAKKLSRTKSQIRAMAKNMGLKNILISNTPDEE